MAMTLDGTNGVFLPTWTTATRPASPANGELGYNSTTGQLDQYVSGAWSSIPTGSGSSATPTSLGTVYGITPSSTAAVALGYQAATTTTSATGVTAIGYQALTVNTGNNNTSVGYQAGYNNTTGNNNTAIGRESLYTNTTGATNTAVGFQALLNNTTGGLNVCLGYQAGGSLTTGSNNVCLGIDAGTYSTTLTTGTFNTLIGYGADASSTSASYQIVLCSNPSTGKGDSTGFINPHGGGVYQGNNSSSWSTTSDQRLKKNIVDNTIGLEAINQIKVRNFEYRTEDEITDLPKNQVIKKDGIQLGAIAQELQQILPDCVKQESTGVLSVDTSNITWHLINAIKELNTEVQSLKAKVGV